MERVTVTRSVGTRASTPARAEAQSVGCGISSCVQLLPGYILYTALSGAVPPLARSLTRLCSRMTVTVLIDRTER
jgi:hypothetical protein